MRLGSPRDLIIAAPLIGGCSALVLGIVALGFGARVPALQALPWAVLFLCMGLATFTAHTGAGWGHRGLLIATLGFALAMGVVQLPSGLWFATLLLLVLSGLWLGFDPSFAGRPRDPLALVWWLGLLLLLVVVLMRSAWVAEDAYITFRTVDNWLHGFGLTWNPGQRVQVYTHPLWMLLVTLATGITGNLYLAVMTLSLGSTLLAVALFFPVRSADRWAAVLAVMALAGSKAFVDYSVSGLENPLTFLLLALFFRTLLSPDADRRLGALFLIAGLAGLNRLDTLLFFLPPLALLVKRAVQDHRPWLRPFLIGLAPLAAWEVFSLFYYGFLFPNTAYAKLNTGIPWSVTLRQGIYYLSNAFRLDLLLLPWIVLALLRSWTRTESAPRWAAAGILAYLAYVVAIGGDSMGVRFLAAPFLAAIMLLAYLEPISLPRFVTIGLVLDLVSLGLPAHPWTVDANYERALVDDQGIADERGFYYPATGLLRSVTVADFPQHRWIVMGKDLRRQGPLIVVHQNMGLLGYYAGPQSLIVDRYALCDPLLARMPIMRPERGRWRVSHYPRRVPEGYLESLVTGDNRISDIGLAEYYTHLKRVISGPLADPTRWLDIWNLNWGVYDPLIDPKKWSQPQAIEDISKTAP